MFIRSDHVARLLLSLAVKPDKNISTDHSATQSSSLVKKAIEHSLEANRAYNYWQGTT